MSSTQQDVESQLNPPRAQQISDYLSFNAAYIDPFSGQANLDIVMATIQALNARIKTLEQKTLSLRVA
jgi:hypothetical protein